MDVDIAVDPAIVLRQPGYYAKRLISAPGARDCPAPDREPRVLFNPPLDEVHVCDVYPPDPSRTNDGFVVDDDRRCRIDELSSDGPGEYEGKDRGHDCEKTGLFPAKLCNSGTSPGPKDQSGSAGERAAEEEHRNVRIITDGLAIRIRDHGDQPLIVKVKNEPNSTAECGAHRQQDQAAARQRQIPTI